VDFNKPKEGHQEKIVCPECPLYAERLRRVTSERDAIRALLAHREDLIERLTRSQKQPTPSKEKDAIIADLKAHIREIESEGDGKYRHIVEEKRKLLMQVERLEQQLRERGEQLAYMVKELQAAQPERAKAANASLSAVDASFSTSALLSASQLGMDIKPGSAKLKVRVADAQSVPSIPDGELFVRLECGKATQFTQPQPLLKGVCTWQHDFLFIDLPVHPDSRDHTVLKADGALKTEVLSRTIGETSEDLMGAKEIDLSGLVQGQSQTVTIPMTSGGCVNLELCATGFGMPVSASADQFQSILDRYSAKKHIEAPQLPPHTVLTPRAPEPAPPAPTQPAPVAPPITVVLSQNTVLNVAPQHLNNFSTAAYNTTTSYHAAAAPPTSSLPHYSSPPLMSKPEPLSYPPAWVAQAAAAPAVSSWPMAWGPGLSTVLQNWPGLLQSPQYSTLPVMQSRYMFM
jgi:hypothetical protein